MKLPAGKGIRILCKCSLSAGRIAAKNPNIVYT
jgi:hypothetical protein